MVLLRSGTLLLKQVIDEAGPVLTDAGALVSLLGIQSTRTFHKALELWRRRLIDGEKLLLARYHRGNELDPEDLFPALLVTPQLGNASCPLLEKAQELNLHT